MSWSVVRVLVFGLAVFVVTACGSSNENASVVRFLDSGDSAAGALITPLVGSIGPDGNVVAFAVDPNSSPVVADGSGRFQIDHSVAPETAGIQVSIEVPSASGPAVGQLDWRGTYDPAAVGVDVEVPEPKPCGDAGNCGQQLLPDLIPIIGWDDLDSETVARLEPQTQGPPTAGLFPAETWFVEDADGARLLRFATVAANVGDGPLDIIAEPGNRDGSRTWQRIWTDSWHFEDHLSGEFVFHSDHDHIHFDAFERYRLLDNAGEIVASSEKVSFCLRDSVRIADERPPPVGPMLVDDGECKGQQQVINPGFGDHYHALLDDQWIDISGVPLGTYTVEVVIDPLDLIRESDESNNVGTFEVEIG